MDAHTSVNASMPTLENTNALRGTNTINYMCHVDQINVISLIYSLIL